LSLERSPGTDPGSGSPCLSKNKMDYFEKHPKRPA